MCLMESVRAQTDRHSLSCIVIQRAENDSDRISENISFCCVRQQLAYFSLLIQRDTASYRIVMSGIPRVFCAPVRQRYPPALSDAH